MISTCALTTADNLTAPQFIAKYEGFIAGEYSKSLLAEAIRYPQKELKYSIEPNAPNYGDWNEGSVDTSERLYKWHVVFAVEARCFIWVHRDVGIRLASSPTQLRNLVRTLDGDYYNALREEFDLLSLIEDFNQIMIDHKVDLTDEDIELEASPVPFLPIFKGWKNDRGVVFNSKRESTRSNVRSDEYKVPIMVLFQKLNYRSGSAYRANEEILYPAELDLEEFFSSRCSPSSNMTSLQRVPAPEVDRFHNGVLVKQFLRRYRTSDYDDVFTSHASYVQKIQHLLILDAISIDFAVNEVGLGNTIKTLMGALSNHDPSSKHNFNKEFLFLKTYDSIASYAKDVAVIMMFSLLNPANETIAVRSEALLAKIAALPSDRVTKFYRIKDMTQAQRETVSSKIVAYSEEVIAIMNHIWFMSAMPILPGMFEESLKEAMGNDATVASLFPAKAVEQGMSSEPTPQIVPQILERHVGVIREQVSVPLIQGFVFSLCRPSSSDSRSRLEILSASTRAQRAVSWQYFSRLYYVDAILRKLNTDGIESSNSALAKD